MSNSDNSGCLAIFVIIIYIVAWVGSGTLAWNWVDPKSFLGAVFFIFVWGILGYIAQSIAAVIFALITSNMH